MKKWSGYNWLPKTSACTATYVARSLGRNGGDALPEVPRDAGPVGWTERSTPTAQ